LSEQEIATSEMGSQGSSCDAEFLSRQWQQRVDGVEKGLVIIGEP
jgi:hypothetical protein